MSLSSPLTWGALPVLAWTLLHFIWQGALVGLAHGAVRKLLPPAASQARHATALLALALLALLPVLTFIHLWAGFAPVAATTGALPDGALAAVAGDPSVTGGDGRLAAWVVALWLAGVLLMALRSLRQWCALQRALRRWSRPDARLAALLQGLARRFRYRGPLRVLVCERIDTPTLIGWLRPVILMPAAIALRFPQAQIEHILAHELGHLCRRDHLVNLLQALLETLLFYHPVVHWISRHVREDREICCDLLVLERTGGVPCEYARTLVALEELRQPPVQLALAANGGVLLERVRRIVGATTDERAPGTRRLVLGLLATLLVALAGFFRLDPPAPVQVAVPAAPVIRLAANTLIAADLTPMPAPRPRLLPGVAEVAAVVAQPAPAVAMESGQAPRQMQPSAPPLALAASQPAASDPAASQVAGDEAPMPVPEGVATAAPRVLAAAPTATAAPVPAPDAGDAAPRLVPVHMVSPEYPFDAHADVAQRVELEFRVRRNGSVRDIEVLAGPRDAAFARAAERALGKWRFDPTSVVADARYRQVFEFVLPGQQASADAGCVRKTGSMLCRHAGAPEDEPGATAANESAVGTTRLAGR